MRAKDGTGRFLPHFHVHPEKRPRNSGKPQRSPSRPDLRRDTLGRTDFRTYGFRRLLFFGRPMVEYLFE